MHKLTISGDPFSPTIMLDDRKVEGCTAFTICGDGPGTLCRATLTLDVDVDVNLADAEVETK